MWSGVELLMNEDTGTVRLCGEQEPGSAVYQVDTLVKISASEKVTSFVDFLTFNHKISRYIFI